jgi:hypothetical protein
MEWNRGLCKEQRQSTEMEREQQALQSSRQSAEGIKVFFACCLLACSLVLSRHWLTAGECRSMQCNNASVFGRLVSFHKYSSCVRTVPAAESSQRATVSAASQTQHCALSATW